MFKHSGPPWNAKDMLIKNKYCGFENFPQLVLGTTLTYKCELCMGWIQNVFFKSFNRSQFQKHLNLFIFFSLPFKSFSLLGFRGALPSPTIAASCLSAVYDDWRKIKMKQKIFDNCFFFFPVAKNRHSWLC